MSSKSLAIIVLLLAAILVPVAPALADHWGGHGRDRVVVLDDGWGRHGHRHHGPHWRGCDRVYVRETVRPCPPPHRVVVKEVWVSRPAW